MFSTSKKLHSCSCSIYYFRPIVLCSHLLETTFDQLFHVLNLKETTFDQLSNVLYLKENILIRIHIPALFFVLYLPCTVTPFLHVSHPQKLENTPPGQLSCVL